MPLPGQLFPYTDAPSSQYSEFEDTINTMRASATKSSRFKALKKITTSALTIILLLLPESLFDLITLYYAGYIPDTNKFSAIALTLVSSNLFIRRVITCCTASLRALIKQALHHEQYYRISSHYQKTVILTVTWTIIGITLITGFWAILGLLKYPPGFTTAFLRFNCLLIPANLFNLLLSLLRSLYLSYGIQRFPMYFMWLRIALSIACNILFCKVLGPGLLSVGISCSIAETVTALSLYLYTKRKNKFIQALGFPYTNRVFAHLPSFFRLLIKRGAPVYLSRVSLDLLVIIVVFLREMEAVAAQASLSAYASFVQVVPFAICLATYKYFNQATEEGNELKAKNYAVKGCVSVLVVCGLLTGLNLGLFSVVPKIFWDNPLYQATLRTLLIIYSVAMWGDVSFYVMSIVFKRLIGRRYAMKAAFVVLICISTPLSAVLGLWVEWDVTGIWGSRLFCMLLVNLVLVKKLAVLDWWQQVRKLHFERKEEFEDSPIDL